LIIGSSLSLSGVSDGVEGAEVILLGIFLGEHEDKRNEDGLLGGDEEGESLL
jgi:hypothetical protein